MIRKGMLAFLVAFPCITNSVWSQETEEKEQEAKQESVRSVPAILLLPAKRTAGDDVTDSNAQQEVDGDSETKKEFKATHSEVAPLVPKRDGEKGRLHTFKLDNRGYIVAGLTFSGKAHSTAEGEDTETVSAKSTDSNNVLQVYNPDFQLERQISTGFQPTALTIDPDGNYLCGGEGQLALYSPDGQLLKSAPSPNMGTESAEERRAKLVEEYRKQMEDLRKVYQKQLDTIAEQIAAIEEKYKDSDEEMSRRDKARLESLQAQTESYGEFLKQQENAEISEGQIDAMIRASGGINSIAVTGNDVFVTVRSGQGYEIWRTDRDFTGGEKIKEGLRGCCGQMDIDAGDGKLFIAENCEFQVGIYDREGKRLHSFGERANEDNMGFGSCCNPMNVVCCPNGDILTAESSIGKVKRYNEYGELAAYIGKARIGGGCKHVSIGFDESRDRYYVQYEDENTICVLVPNSEAELLNAEATAERRKAEEKLAGLDGTWTRVRETETPAGEAKKDNDDEDGEASQVEGVIVIGDQTMTMEKFLAMQTDFSELIIDSAKQTIAARVAANESENDDDPEAAVFTGAAANQQWQLIPQRMDGEKAVFDLEDSSGMVTYVYSVLAVDDRTIDVWIKSDFGALGNPLRFTRVSRESGEK